MAKKPLFKIDIVTLFPEMFAGPLTESIIKRARERGLVKINIHNLRDYTRDKHRAADDKPFGGGPGMVLKPEPIFRAVKKLRKRGSRVILLGPGGQKLKQPALKRLAEFKHLILLCGHYEGVDERVKKIVLEEISIGDYILTGGELPAMVLVDALVRLVPGVLGDAKSAEEESFSSGLLGQLEMKSLTGLEYPQYTRPASYRGIKVPQILLSGNHEKIKQWREKQAQKRTLAQRPDLIRKG